MKTDKEIVAEMLQRMKDITAHFDVSVRKLSAQINITPTKLQNAIYRGCEISQSTLYKLLKRYPTISPKWLLTGEGEMIVDNNVLRETNLALGETLLAKSELEKELEEAKQKIEQQQIIIEQISSMLEQQVSNY
ncbi:MAG: hypothetical protein MJZ96_01755 [Paludibacteraceae bacterium]|nr:hypothetical protein [Paludibacteraceae bacterium]